MTEPYRPPLDTGASAWRCPHEVPPRRWRDVGALRRAWWVLVAPMCPMAACRRRHLGECHWCRNVGERVLGCGHSPRCR